MHYSHKLERDPEWDRLGTRKQASADGFVAAKSDGTAGPGQEGGHKGLRSPPGGRIIHEVQDGPDAGHPLRLGQAGF